MGDGHADLSAQAGDDDAEGAGVDPGERRAGLGAGGLREPVAHEQILSHLPPVSPEAAGSAATTVNATVPSRVLYLGYI